MNTFSKVIAPPTASKRSQHGPQASSQPVISSARWCQGLPILRPDSCPLRISQENGLAGHSRSIDEKPVWWKNPGFYARGVVEPVLTRAAPQVARDRYLLPSPPPFVPPEGNWTEPSLAYQSSPELLSPPQTACSTVAVLGSAGLDRTFEEDYDRWEANPDFVRHCLRRSRSLRRQARMRDGDFRDTDDEGDFSVSPEAVVAIAPKVNASQILRHFDVGSFTPGAVACPAFANQGRRVEAPSPTNSDSPSSSSSPSSLSWSDGLSSRGPSRLSQRVRPPPPIDTHKSTLRNGDRYRVPRVVYEIENSPCVGAPRSLPSDSGFDADDEDESPPMLPVRVGRMPAAGGLHAVLESAQEVPADTMPTKKTYASVVASSPPRGSRPASRTAVVVQRRGRIGTIANAYDWQPFIEPVDVQ